MRYMSKEKITVFVMARSGSALILCTLKKTMNTTAPHSITKRPRGVPMLLQRSEAEKLGGGDRREEVSGDPLEDGRWVSI
jgi:hypothetical protein